MAQGAKPLALTMGEPAGIAPDITLMAWRKARTDPSLTFLYIGDPALLAARAKRLAAEIPIISIASPSDAVGAFSSGVPVLPLPLAGVPEPGTLRSDNARMVWGSIERAVDLALAGVVDAVVTNPIHKRTLYGAGFAHQGHTDFLAHMARAKGHPAQPVMMLVVDDLRTVPITIHIAVKDVAGALRTEAIAAQSAVVARGLERYFGIARPRLAITGLNPHAGEGGSIGDEESRIILPAIAELHRQGFDVAGPFPADSMFHEAARKSFDAIICMYHDQALIPVKLLGFHAAVNVTLGLPFIRTSPDHGTALSIAGSGRAVDESLIAALQLARRMADSGGRERC
ncbi:MAG: 4-hydroxythreonine-4-phosphate dehydrogenase PdxA [Pseudomonadota bacterium]|nr:4-hydroxythreonine-4-phosphate dehydrogenase PdxA [Pseudomonadota bacterium]